MRNRINTCNNDNFEQHEPEKDGPPIADVLEELLLRYAARFPGLKILVVHLPPATS